MSRWLRPSKQNLKRTSQPGFAPGLVAAVATPRTASKSIEEGLKDKDRRYPRRRLPRRPASEARCARSSADEILADRGPVPVARAVPGACSSIRARRFCRLIVKLADKYNGDDRWYLEAFGIAANGREKAVLAAWEKEHQNKDPKNNEGIQWRLKMEAVQLGSEKEAKPAAPEKHASAQGGARPFVD